MNENSNIKEYTNDEVTVLWEASKCTHSANCVKNLSEVFKPKEKPWVQMENSTSEKIVSTVAKCPSGALSIKK
mgnify:FL=1